MSSGWGVPSNDMLSAKVDRLNSLPASAQFETSHEIGMICDFVVLESTQIISHWSANLIIEGLRNCYTPDRKGPAMSSKRRYLGFQKR